MSGPATTSPTSATQMFSARIARSRLAGDLGRMATWALNRSVVGVTAGPSVAVSAIARWGGRTVRLTEAVALTSVGSAPGGYVPSRGSVVQGAFTYAPNGAIWSQVLAPQVVT